MNKDINNYHIKNPDGADKTVRNEGKQSFLNDNPRFIKEDLSKGQSEWDNTVSENFGSQNKGADKSDARTISGEVSSSSGSSSALSSATSSASAASASTAASAASAVGGSIGAVAGSVAASAVAAAVVVVAFVSTLVVNLSLVMATMFSLVFQVELKGAQEEDFATPIYAVLSDENGIVQTLEIRPDTLILTFDDLESGKEYTVTVKNEEKEFFKKSYFTATEEVEQGHVSVRNERGEVFVSVENVELKSGEYYTLIVKDEKGNVVFAKDSVEQNVEFRFTVDKTVNLSFALSVGGKVYAVETLQVEIARKPKYDYQNPTWSWANDYSSATVTISDLNGGEPLKITANVQTKRVAPTCEENGYVSYIATAEFNGQRYEDSKQSIEENTALGHEYGTLIPSTATCEDSGIAAHYYCTVCEKYFDENKKETTYDELYAPATGHSYGELITATDPTCDEVGIAEHYECSVCHAVFDVDKNETTLDELYAPATGHDYGAPVFEWTEIGDGDYTATAKVFCSHDSNHYIELPDVTVVQGNYEFTAYVDYNGESYNDTLYLGDPNDPTLSDGVVLDITNGNIVLYADGYEQNDVFTAFENRENSRYTISGSRGADTPLRFNAKTHNGESAEDVVNYYVDFDNAEIKGTIFATAVVINPYSDVNIYITNIGTSTIKGGNHVAFEAQDVPNHNINIYVTSDNGFTDFVCGRQDGQSPTLYSYKDGTMLFEMNDKQVDNNGNNI